jgi:hypothetical protein
MKTYKQHKDYGFWDQNLCLSKISKLEDTLDRLNEDSRTVWHFREQFNEFKKK